jgi:hypothetical protein
MSVLVDARCHTCATTKYDVDRLLLHTPHKGCGGRWERVWAVTRSRDAAVHSSERAVVYYSPKEDRYQYTGRNNEAIPRRLAKRGYERREMSSLKDLDRHHKQTGKLSHVAHYDPGSGNSLDGG